MGKQNILLFPTYCLPRISILRFRKHSPPKYVGDRLGHVDLGQTNLFSHALAERIDHKVEKEERAWKI